MPHESTVPTFDALMWPALKAMKALGGSANHDELLEKLVEIEKIPESVQNVMHTESLTKLSYNLSWAKTWLGKYGALENPSHGVWAITAKGKTLTEGEVKQVPAEVRKLYKNKKKPEGADEGRALDQEAKTWKEELLGVVTGIKPDAFERLAQRVLRESGFVKVEVTGKSGDGGIDGVGVLRLKLLSFQVYFQCKRYKGSVSPSAIRDFRGAMIGRSRKSSPSLACLAATSSSACCARSKPERRPARRSHASRRNAPTEIRMAASKPSKPSSTGQTRKAAM